MSNLVEVKNLKKYFPMKQGILHAVDDVSFDIEKGKTLGIVGESGCGKSTLGRTLIHLYESTSGKIFFEGRDVTVQKGKELKRLHQEMAMIFQDPYSSLNPRYKMSETLSEAIRLTHKYKKKETEEQMYRVMEMVGLDKRFANAYPHELDGGRLQRIGIGRALALDPKFIICDEPVSKLDVSIQAQILNLLMDLQDQMGLTYMFITHNMSVVHHISDEVCVMYLGQLVESGPTKEIFRYPSHPYTKALLAAIPSTDIYNQKESILMKGELSSPIDPEPGCRFAKRCPHRCEQCSEPQELKELTGGHFVACCRADEIP